MSVSYDDDDMVIASNFDDYDEYEGGDFYTSGKTILPHDPTVKVRWDTWEENNDLVCVTPYVPTDTKPKL